MSAAKGCILLMTIAAAANATASSIPLNAFTGNETVIDFENLSTMGQPPLGLTYPGVTILNLGQVPGYWGVESGTNNLVFNHIPGASLGKSIIDQTALANIHIEFGQSVQPVNRVGFLIYGGTNSQQVGPTIFDVTVSRPGYESETVVVTETDTGDVRGMFVGIEVPWEILRLDIVERPGQNSVRMTSTMIDDLRYEAVPEPATWVLAIAPAFMLCAMLRTRLRRVAESIR